MKVKYYGVPHNAITLQCFLKSVGVSVSKIRSERLFILYRWLLEAPRQWEHFGLVSIREPPPDCYAKLKDSTYAADVQLLARAKLIFPMYAEASPIEAAERRFSSVSTMKNLLRDPAFSESIVKSIADPFGEHN